ncbi:hypothetical protein HMN09_00273600 [Mycena chlorophos]|uniref:Uncharacterized protein n=1 Tax=Mycena chlorophos TaxID=658473 RepID=A0A8H6WP27_MYCCL|nr:hypothetical protein HMN09_00273600 [Mycena chlorophos]
MRSSLRIVALLLATASVVFSRATPTRRDFPPLIVTLPAGQTLSQFDEAFDDECVNWQPAIDAGYSFDFSSESVPPEAGQAEVQCQWDAANGIEINFAQAVAESLGAYPVSS